MTVEARVAKRTAPLLKCCRVLVVLGREWSQRKTAATDTQVMEENTLMWMLAPPASRPCSLRYDAFDTTG